MNKEKMLNEIVSAHHDELRRVLHQVRKAMIEQCQTKEECVRAIDGALLAVMGEQAEREGL